MGNSFTEIDTTAGTSGWRKLLILGAAVLVIAAVGWIPVLIAARSGSTGSGATGYRTGKRIQYSYTLQNKTNRVIEKAEFWAHAPVKQTASQRCQELTANYPFQTISDPYGNQVLHFTFNNLAPYATRIITIKANLLVSASANPDCRRT